MNPQRLEAIKSGQTTFDPGIPCKYGHDSPRYTRSGQCVTCSKETSKKAYQAIVGMMPAREANQEEKVLIPHTIYLDKLHCLRCPHQWRPRKPEVRRCPRCQSPWWDTPKDGQGEPVQVKPKTTPKPQEDFTLFNAFWQKYPRKVAKHAALNAWKRIVKTEDQAYPIINALEVQKLCPQWTKDGGAFIPHPATWLNQHRWEDETTPGRPMGMLEPCTARVRSQDGSRFVPCGKPSIRKQGMGYLCEHCDRDYQARKATMDAEAGSPKMGQIT